jgi:hypothetical protein
MPGIQESEIGRVTPVDLHALRIRALEPFLEALRADHPMACPCRPDAPGAIVAHLHVCAPFCGDRLKKLALSVP